MPELDLILYFQGSFEYFFLRQNLDSFYCSAYFSLHKKSKQTDSKKNSILHTQHKLLFISISNLRISVSFLPLRVILFKSRCCCVENWIFFSVLLLSLCSKAPTGNFNFYFFSFVPFPSFLLVLPVCLHAREKYITNLAQDWILIWARMTTSTISRHAKEGNLFVVCECCWWCGRYEREKKL